MDDFLKELTYEGAPLIVVPAQEGGGIKKKYRETKWANSPNGNEDRLAKHSPGDGVLMMTGHGVSVHDIDNGRTGVDYLIDNGLVPPLLAVVKSPNRGWHLYFRSTGARKSDLPGINELEGGGAVLVAPTPGYVRLDPCDWPEGLEEAQDPAALDRMRAMAAAKEAARTRREKSAEIPEGAPSVEQLEKARNVLNKRLQRVEFSEYGRNNTVNEALYVLYPFVKAGCLDREQVEDALWDAVQRAPGAADYDRDEFDGQCDKKWQQAVAELPRIEWPDVPFDTHNQRYLAQWLSAHGLGTRWVNATGMGWLSWDGKRWCKRTEDATREAIGEAFQRATFAAIEEGRDTKVIDAVRRLQNAGPIGQVLTVLRGHAEVNGEDFDNEPGLLNVANGVVDLETGERRPHDPKYLFTKIAPAQYVPGATHPDWDKVLTSLDPEVMDYMQMRFGQAITGHKTSDGVLPIMVGTGHNGKSTVTDGLAGALGDYYTLVPDKVLLGNVNDHSTELTTLKGARVCVVDEMPEGARVNVSRLKKLQDTDQISARALYRDTMTWSSSHSLFILTNHRPIITETDEGTWRRLQLINFTKSYALDGAFKQRIKSGTGGIREAVLAWAVAGAVRFYENRALTREPLDVMKPALVEKDTDEWREQTDLVLGFIREHLEFDHRCSIAKTDMHMRFNDWAHDRGHLEWSARTFTDRFGGHKEARSNRVSEGFAPPSGEGVEPRLFGAVAAAEKRPRVWRGVRWRGAE